MPRITAEVRIRPNRRNILDSSENHITVGGNTYTFSHVHQQTTNKELFCRSVLPFLTSFSGGENCTLIAYGQTGSGKTYTMGISHNQENGVIQHCLRTLFEDSNIKMYCSYIEIYNECIFDLLSDSRIPLSIRQGKDETTVVGLKEDEIRSYEDAMDLLVMGSHKRITKYTKMNSNSSRSHAIFTLILRQAKGETFVESRMSFVDLAGSERLKRTQCTGTARMEAININSGLLSLGNVINALYLDKSHVPFRDSKLTRILQKCLVGHVLLIACVSGLEDDLFETTNTLKYAARAALISLNDKVNVLNDKDKLIIENMKKEISKLKEENMKLKSLLTKTSLSHSDVLYHPLVSELLMIIKKYDPKFNLNEYKTYEINMNGLKISQEDDMISKNVNDKGGYCEVRTRDYDEANLNYRNKSPTRTYTMIEGIKEDTDSRTELKDKTKEWVSNIDNLLNRSPNKKLLFGSSNEEDSNDSDTTVYVNEDFSNDPDMQKDPVTISNTIRNANLSPGERVFNNYESGKRIKVVKFLDDLNKYKLELVETIQQAGPLNLTFYNDMLIFNTLDGKVGCIVSGRINTIISEDRIRCIYSCDELYYTTRSLLKVYSVTGRSRPVYAYKREITALFISGAYIYTGHEDGTICVLDIMTNHLAGHSKAHDGAITDIQLTNSKLYTSSQDGTIRMNEINTSEGRIFTKDQFQIVAHHNDSVTALVKFKDSIISLSKDCNIKYLGECIKTVRGHNTWIKCGWASENYLITGCKGGNLKFWELNSKMGSPNLVQVGSFEVGSPIISIIGDSNHIWVGCQNKCIFKYKLR